MGVQKHYFMIFLPMKLYRQRLEQQEHPFVNCSDGHLNHTCKVNRIPYLNGVPGKNAASLPHILFPRYLS